MTKLGRIPCINPRCKRTAPADKYPDDHEIICRKCFNAAPAELRAEHRRCWREIGKWERRILRTGDELRIQRMNDIVDMWAFKLRANWRRLREHVRSPDRPAGIETFLDEMGMM